MRTIVPLCLLAMISSALFAISPERSSSKEEQAVRDCVELYFEGARTAKPEPFQKAWNLEHGRMVYVRTKDDTQKLRSKPIVDAIKSWTANPPEDSWGKILSLDIIESKMAIAKVKLLFRGTIYVDFLSLYKINGKWKIVNKTFVSLGKADSAESSEGS